MDLEQEILVTPLVVQSYLLQLLSNDYSINRNNSKTDETARYGYYKINSSSGSANTGIIAETEPQNMVTFFENELILAEAKARQGEYLMDFLT